MLKYMKQISNQIKTILNDLMLNSLIGLALSGSAGMTLLILACTLTKEQNWWPAIVTIFHLLAPFPILIARSISGDNGGFGGQSNPPKEWAYFTTTGIIISAIALPIIMAGAHTVSIWGQLILHLCSLIYAR